MDKNRYCIKSPFSINPSMELTDQRRRTDAENQYSVINNLSLYSALQLLSKRIDYRIFRFSFGKIIPGTNDRNAKELSLTNSFHYQLHINVWDRNNITAVNPRFRDRALRTDDRIISNLM